MDAQAVAIPILPNTRRTSFHLLKARQLGLFVVINDLHDTIPI